MGAETRQQILDSARYLREVRPLDPEELAEYVDGGAHPGVVRQVLREAAFELDLVERPRGDFVPVPTGPLDPAFEGVTTFPETYDRSLADALVERFGPEWHTGESGNRLRNRVRAIKAAYFAGDPVEYDRVTALAYALYHLPQTYAATQYVLHDLGADGLLPRAIRVLDVGAGVGGPALGFADYWLGRPDNRRTPVPGRIEYHAVEPGAGATLLKRLLGHTGPNLRATIHREPIEEHTPEGPFDLILLANVLSEIADPAATLGRCLDALASDGTVVAIAPADLDTATGLRRIERRTVAADLATVYAPTAWLWPGRSPADSGWSFDRRPDIDPPPTQRRLADGGDDPATFRNTPVKVAYSLLRRDGRRRHELTLTRSEAIPLGDLEDVVTDRVDVVAVKLSRDLRDATAEVDTSAGNPIFRIGDGSQIADCYAVLVHETGLNAALLDAGYGALLRIEGGLVLWNDDEEAFNVVVDEDTVVDRLGAGAPDP